jgi:hypothetical protein
MICPTPMTSVSSRSERGSNTALSTENRST